MTNRVTTEEYALAAQKGISRGHVVERVDRYHWDIEKAVTDPIRIHEDHQDWAKVAQAHDIAAKTYYARVKSGWPHERAATERVDRKKCPKMYRKRGTSDE